MKKNFLSLSFAKRSESRRWWTNDVTHKLDEQPFCWGENIISTRNRAVVEITCQENLPFPL